MAPGGLHPEASVRMPTVTPICPTTRPGLTSNTAPAGNPRVHVPWKDELISEWVRLARIGPPDAPESQQKIDRLTRRIADHKRLWIGDLTDRSAMLMDLRSRLSLMNRDLRDLIKAINVPAAP